MGAVVLCGCGNLSYSMPYAEDTQPVYVQQSAQVNMDRADSFASDLCVVSGDLLKESVDASDAGAALLLDIKNREVMFAKAAHEKMYPASMTKVMTAIIALENGSLDMILTATDAVKITEAGAAVIGLKPGDTMTLDQALHILLIASANDVALMIADNIGGGSVDRFVEMMNDRAQELGATNTHFMNPHGLTDPNHYTTAYDMYLMFNEALKYDTFNQIIQMSSYQTTYYDKNGKAVNYDKGSTNRYFIGKAQAPDNVTVMGGKTGTTNAAGHCLVLHSKDIKGNSYISVIMRCTKSDYLYEEMTDLLEEINK